MSINRIFNIQEWRTIGTGSTPSTGFEIIYPKNDGNWYHMGSDGYERILSLAYNLGDGFTYSTATNSSIYNFDVKLALDNYGLTFSNGRLSIGYITASNLSQNGGGTAGFILSVDSNGIPTWVPYTTQGVDGLINYLPKYNTSNSLTNSNIYDDGTSVIIGGTISNLVGGFQPSLYVTGNLDVANRLYFTSSSIYLSGNNSSSKLTLSSLGFSIINSSYTLFDATWNNTTGPNIKLLNNTITITATASNNATASVILPSITTIGIGTASPTHLLHLFATQSAFRLVDGSQGNGKLLISDSNGVSSWYMPSGLGLSITGYTFSIQVQNNSGLTASINGLSVLLQNNSGLTLSSSGLSIDPNRIGSGLTFSGGTLSVTSIASNITTGNGLTSSGSVFSVLLTTNSGLTVSSTGLSIDPNRIGSGLTFSGGTLSVTSVSANINGTTNYISYFLNSSTLTASVIFQTNSNILIGTTTSSGSKLHIQGSFSSTADVYVNNLRIGRNNNTANISIGNGTLDNSSSGSNNIAIGDNSLINANSISNNITIGRNSGNNIINSSGSDNIILGNNSFSNTNTGNNIVIGNSSSISVGGNSVNIGMLSGFGGFGNISIGYKTGGFSSSNTSGGYNVFLGYESGSSFTGSYSVFIGGYNSSSNTSNNIFISDGQGNLRLYVPSTGNVLIGTMSDVGSKLYIAGSVSIVSQSTGALRIVDTNQGLGKFLMSDNNGVASWYSGFGAGLTLSGFTFSILLNSNSGLTISSSGISNNIGMGLTLSNNFIILNTNIAGTGLTYSNGVINSLLSSNQGLTLSGNSFSVNIGIGLTLSNNFIILNSNIAGAGLTYSNGVINSLLSSNRGLTLSGNSFSANIGIGLTLSNNFIILNPTIIGTTLTYSNGIINTLITSGIGMTYSGNILSANIGTGLTLSNNFIALNPNIIGTTLTYSNGIINTLVNTGVGLTSSLNTFSIDPNISGYGLTYSSGSMSFTTNINSTQGYIPYFITTTALTSSVIYQTSSNILIGTVSNNGAILQIAGSVSIISATGNAFRLVDGSQGSGKILESDANGFASWQSYKYSATQSFTANLASVVNHNLNSMFYIIQLFDYTTGEEILGGYSNRGLTQATITLTQDVNNCGVVIMG